MKNSAYSKRHMILLLILFGISVVIVPGVYGQTMQGHDTAKNHFRGYISEAWTSDNSSILLLGNYTHEISVGQIESAQTDVLIRYKISHKISRLTVIDARPIPEDSAILAFGYAIRNKTVYSFTSQIPNTDKNGDPVNWTADVESVREAALEWYNQLPPDNKGNLSDSENLVYLSYDTHTESKEPYGSIVSTVELKKSGYTKDDNTQYGLIFEEKFGVNPGIVVWDKYSHWQQDTFSSSHDYSISKLSDTNLYDYEPGQGFSGSTSTTISVSLPPKGMSESWGYSQGDYTLKVASTAPTGYAKWTYTPNSDVAKTGSSMTHPGSSGYFTMPATKGDYDFTGIRDSAKFCNFGNCFAMGSKELNLKYDLVVKIV